MSNSVTPLGGIQAKVGAMTLNDMGLQGMITYRGDLSSKALATALKALTGQAVPAQGKANVRDGKGAAWMSPDELLILFPYAEAAQAVGQITKALGEAHHLVVNVSDARGYISLSGQGAAEVMAKNAPVDLHPDVFTSGTFRRSRLGQVAAAFWRDEEGAFHVICFRSVAEYLYQLLEVSAQGGDVGAF